MITAQVEPYAACLPELVALYPAHWDELALDKDKPEAALDPMWGVYEDRDADGHILLVTLREDGRLVGYFLGFVAPGLHYRRCLTYHMDIFYIVRSARGKFGGKRMMRTLISECRRRGVKRMFVGEKLHCPAGRLFEAVGFAPVETTYSLWLGD